MNKVTSLYSVRNRNLNKLAVHLNIDSLRLKFESLALLANLYLYVQINLQKKEWLLCCSYNPNKNAIKSHIEILHKGLGFTFI